MKRTKGEFATELLPLRLDAMAEVYFRLSSFATAPGVARGTQASHVPVVHADQGTAPFVDDEVDRSIVLATRNPEKGHQDPIVISHNLVQIQAGGWC